MVTVTEKPEWVSWDEIAEVIHAAHAKNIQNGVVMRYAQLPGDEIRKRIEGRGTMVVALDGKRVVGTGAVHTVMLHNQWWYGTGEVAYYCFASVLPEYEGQGIYKQISIYREKIVRKMGLSRIMYDTNADNIHQQEIAKRAGYKFVKYKYEYGHMSVVAIKWLDGCPYSDFYLKYHLLKTLYSIKWDRFKEKFISKK